MNGSRNWKWFQLPTLLFIYPSLSNCYKRIINFRVDVITTTTLSLYLLPGPSGAPAPGRPDSTPWGRGRGSDPRCCRGRSCSSRTPPARACCGWWHCQWSWLSSHSSHNTTHDIKQLWTPHLLCASHSTYNIGLLVEQPRATRSPVKQWNKNQKVFSKKYFLNSSRY